MTGPQPLFIRRPQDAEKPNLVLKAYAEITTHEHGVIRMGQRYAYTVIDLGGRSVTVPRPMVDLGDDLYAVPGFDYLPGDRRIDGLTVALTRWQLYDVRLGVTLPLVLHVDNPFGPAFTHYRRRYVMEMRIHAGRVPGDYTEAARAWGEQVSAAYDAWAQEQAAHATTTASALSSGD